VHTYEIALDLGETEAANHLAMLYFNNGELMNETLAMEYLDIANKEGDIPNAKLLMISRYLNDPTKMEHFVDCTRIYKEINKLQKHNEIKKMYNFGYEKYVTGQFKQALLIFSFTALAGNKEGAAAAAFIWKQQLVPDMT